LLLGIAEAMGLQLSPPPSRPQRAPSGLKLRLAAERAISAMWNNPNGKPF
jgi:hypothetical protein